MRVFSFSKFAAAVLFLVAQTAVYAGTARAQPGVLSIKEWRADLHETVEFIKETHPRPFRAISEAEFDALVEAIESEIPVLDDKTIILRIAELVQAVGEGHTRLSIPRRFPELERKFSHTDDPPPARAELEFSQLPVAFELFHDGLFITRATPAHENLLGAKVERIGAWTAEEAVEAVRPVTFHDNEQTVKFLAPDRLALPDALKALGATEDAAETPLTVTLDGGATQSVVLAPLEDGAADWVSSVDKLETRPLWLTDNDVYYWSRYLPDRKLVYAQFNRVEDASGRTLAEWIHDTVKLAEDRRARLVIDLRHNHGGSNSLNRSVVLAIIRSKLLNRYGQTFVLTGERTFSAAQSLLNDLERFSRVLRVGENTGARPDSYGDPKKVRLKNSGLTIRVSQLHWSGWLAFDPRDALSPHIEAPLESADYFAGRDPALEAIQKEKISADPARLVEDLLENGRSLPAIIAILNEHYDPDIAESPLAGELVVIARRFERRGDFETMRIACGYGAQLNPDNIDLQLCAGDASRAVGETESARRSYEIVLRLDPANKRAQQSLDALE